MPTRFKVVWWTILAAFWAASWFGVFQFPANWLAAKPMLKAVDQWIFTHAAYPSLFALVVGLTIGTVVIPEAWRIIRNAYFPKLLEPDIDANDAFNLVLNRSKWAKRQLRNWRNLSPTLSGLVLSEPEQARERLESAFHEEIHRLLRSGKITSWGRERFSSGFSPERKIQESEWDGMAIEFERSRPRRIITRGIVLRTRNLENGSLAYSDLRFSRDQVRIAFPLHWRRINFERAANVTSAVGR